MFLCLWIRDGWLSRREVTDEAAETWSMLIPLSSHLPSNKDLRIIQIFKYQQQISFYTSRGQGNQMQTSKFQRFCQMNQSVRPNFIQTMYYTSCLELGWTIYLIYIFIFIVSIILFETLQIHFNLSSVTSHYYVLPSPVNILLQILSFCHLDLHFLLHYPCLPWPHFTPLTNIFISSNNFHILLWINYSY